MRGSRSFSSASCSRPPFFHYGCVCLFCFSASAHAIIRQGIPLLLAVTLRLITTRWTHPLIFPGFFLAIPVVFYAVTLSLGLSVADLRQAGWVFEVNGVDSKWYEYWTLYGERGAMLKVCEAVLTLINADLKKTDFSALVDTIPTQLALVFFGLLHVPINVPGPPYPSSLPVLAKLSQLSASQ